MRDPFEDETTRQQDAIRLYDPLEFPNRRLYAFNKFFYYNFLNPMTSVYEAITVPTVRSSVRNVFQNTGEPITTVNSFLQLDPVNGGKSLTRFVVNTTIGVAGIWDPASYFVQSERRSFDQSFATWRVPPGPYLMWPFFGPTTIRGSVGRTASGYMNPFYYSTLEVAMASDGLYFVNRNSYQGDQLDALYEYSVDGYGAFKDAYEQNLANQYYE
jgi:phospholipid-binding lipoprotein MlaA